MRQLPIYGRDSAMMYGQRLLRDVNAKPITRKTWVCAACRFINPGRFKHRCRRCDVSRPAPHRG